MQCDFSIRGKAVQERIRVVERNVSFEITAIFQSPYRRVKKRSNSKIGISFDYPESFLYYLVLRNIFSLLEKKRKFSLKLFAQIAKKIE